MARTMIHDLETLIARRMRLQWLLLSTVEWPLPTGGRPIASFSWLVYKQFAGESFGNRVYFPCSDLTLPSGYSCIRFKENVDLKDLQTLVVIYSNNIWTSDRRVIRWYVRQMAGLDQLWEKIIFVKIDCPAVETAVSTDFVLTQLGALFGLNANLVTVDWSLFLKIPIYRERLGFLSLINPVISPYNYYCDYIQFHGGVFLNQYLHANSDWFSALEELDKFYPRTNLLVGKLIRRSPELEENSEVFEKESLFIKTQLVTRRLFGDDL